MEVLQLRTRVPDSAYAASAEISLVTHPGHPRADPLQA